MALLFAPSSSLFVLLVCVSSCLGELSLAYKWKYIDYVWPSDELKASAIASGQYNLTQIITNDVQPFKDGRILVTTPKYFDNPASLSVISNSTGDGGPLLEPYPSWEWHKEAGNCSGITSVNRVRLDKCNRLWVVDSGKIGNKQVCSAKIMIFNPDTDRLIEEIVIPDELSHNPNDPSKGRLEIQVVETKGADCAQTWAYIGDPEGWGLIIYDGNKIWRLNDEIFAPDDGESEFSIVGQNITLNLGVASLVLPPPGFVKIDYLLFKPMAAVIGYAAIREQLHNSYSGFEKITYYKENYTGPSQELARDYSSDGILIAGFATQTAIACWNFAYPLVDPYVVTLQVDEEQLQFVSGLKIVNGVIDGVESENVWVMSNRFQQFILGTMDWSDYNFRILIANVNELVNGTYCQSVEHSEVDNIEEKIFIEIEN